MHQTERERDATLCRYAEMSLIENEFGFWEKWLFSLLLLLFSTTNSECFVFYLHVTLRSKLTKCYRRARARESERVCVCVWIYLHICKACSADRPWASSSSSSSCVMLHHSCAIVYLVSPNLNLDRTCNRIGQANSEREKEGERDGTVLYTLLLTTIAAQCAFRMRIVK